MRNRLSVSHLTFAATLVFAANISHALPSVAAENLVVQDPRIVYWNVQASGPSRDGNTTTDEGPNGKRIRSTKIQDGSVCHNYGQSCYCTPAKFRITPSLESKWHVLVDSKDRKETACISGVQPTGHADSKALTREEAKSKREALMEERRAKREAAAK